MKSERVGRAAASDAGLSSNSSLTLNKQFRRNAEEFREFSGTRLTDLPLAIDRVGDSASGTEDGQKIRLAKIARFSIA